MKYYRLVILCALAMATPLAARSEKIKIMPAEVRAGRNLPPSMTKKIDAAFSLAVYESKLYDIIFTGARDSAANSLRVNSGKNPTSLEVAKSLGASQIAFVKADRFVNMIRTEIVLEPTVPMLAAKRGEGYAFINYREKATDRELLDPALILAMRRALVNASGEDSLYAGMHASGVPTSVTKALAVGGISIPTPEGKKKNWEIFAKPVIISYDAAETIFEEASRSPKFVAFDLATRDSVYATNQMYGVENYMKTTEKEIEALRRFGIDYFIGGNVVRRQEGATVELFLFKIERDKVIQTSSASETIYKDSIDDLRAALKRLTKKILSS